MATLDVLDYTVRLDEALLPHLNPAERKMATREVRRLVEDLAFRFAFMDDRVMPEDIDYARALEAIKPPPAAAPVLARRAPVYRKRRVRKSITTLLVLLFLTVSVGAFANLVASERADVLVDEWRVGSSTPRSVSESQSFTVPAGTSRLQLAGPVIVLGDRTGERLNTITVTLLDPQGNARFAQEFTSQNSVYAKRAFEAPPPGEWTLLVDFREAAGSAELTVLAVTQR